MILYYDNLITDVPLVKGVYSELDKIRESNSAYRQKSRFDVSLYTLASYAEIKWSHVVIKYELLPYDKKKQEKFEKFVLKLFPKAKIIYGRSDNQQKFIETINLINTLKDDLIFYAGNNDHPFVASDTKTLQACINEAQELSKKHKYVSIMCFHFIEMLNLTKENSISHELYGKDIRKLYGTDDFFVCLFPRGYFASMQIVNKSLLNKWFCSENLRGLIIKRAENTQNYVRVKNQICIVPKKEICAHFDGYTHYKILDKVMLPFDKAPPLFIPEGFFENKIKIAYCYDKYRNSWVNINPLKDKYSFRDNKNGTDLMISLDNLPLFWKKRISKIDINKKINLENVEKIVMEKYEIQKKIDFPKKSLFFYFFYRIYLHFPDNLFRFVPTPTYRKMQNSKILKRMYKIIFKNYYERFIKKTVNKFKKNL